MQFRSFSYFSEAGGAGRGLNLKLFLTRKKNRFHDDFDSVLWQVISMLTRVNIFKRTEHGEIH